jgi:hypothetical protein
MCHGLPWSVPFCDLCGKFGSPEVAKLMKINGRHEETRTPDLYRVKARVTITYSNLQICGRPPSTRNDV